MSSNELLSIINNIQICNIHSTEMSIILLIMFYLSALLSGYSALLYIRPVTRAPVIGISIVVVFIVFVIVGLSVIIWNKADQSISLFRYMIFFIILSNSISVFLQLCASFINHRIKMTSVL